MWGSKITGYVIEKRDTYNQRWEVAAKTEGEAPVGKVRGLVEGVIYEFRVKAVNKAGESEPSDPSLPHRARPKNAAPRIDRNSMMDIFFELFQFIITMAKSLLSVSR